MPATKKTKNPFQITNNQISKISKYIPAAPEVKFELKSIELPKYKYFHSIMRSLEEIKISWGLSSNINQLKTGRIREKLSELLRVIKK